MNTTSRTVGAGIRIGIALLLAGALGACVSIPQRAWANGAAMTQSRAYQAVLSGDYSMRAHRELQNTLNPRLLNYREVAYPAFGDWWW